MKSDVAKLLDKHPKLVHSNNLKVCSHVQRQDGEWLINTLMIENIDVPFKYRRQKQYKNLQGQRVNVTYYPTTETIAGFEMEYMKVVRIKIT